MSRFRSLFRAEDVELAAVDRLVAGDGYAAGRCRLRYRREAEHHVSDAIVSRVIATGTLSPLVTVQVGSQVSGRIKLLEVDFNSPVKKGQRLAQIDPDLYKAAFENAKANRVAAQANLAGSRVQAANAKLHYERYRQLLALDSIAKQDFDTAQANYESAVAAVDAADGTLAQAVAQESQAELNLGYTEIVSPINGTVISRNVDIGQTVAASLQAPVLFLIAEDLKKMQVDTSVAEADVGRLQDGMTATFNVDAYPNASFTGTIRQIRNNSTTVQNVVTYDAVIDVANPDLRLRPGMTANVTLVVATRPHALRVSNTALRFHPTPALVREATQGAAMAEGSDPAVSATAGDQRVAWRLRGSAIEPVRIQIGITDGTLTEILSGGLEPGDKVVTDASGGEAGGTGFRPL
jgi:HlyD family secretion protein